MTTSPTAKLVLKACPRCHGDLLHDDYEDEYRCLQCARTTSVTPPQVLGRPSTPR